MTETTPRSFRRRAVRPALVAVVGTALALGSVAPAAAAPARRAVARTVAVATGLAGPSAFTFGPRERIWYLERATGRVRILDPRTGAARTFATIGGVRAEGERGALGIALDPRFPRRPFVYVYVTRTQNGRLWNQVVRIRSVDGSGAGTKVLLRSLVGSAANHNGGRILIGPDRKLWIVTGDNAVERHSQNRTRNLRGKVLRINLNGSVPRSNPFGSPIWSYGHRNSFGAAFDPETGRFWQTENGPNCNDEINLITKGGNFAWGPNWRCSSPPTAADTNRDGPLPRRLPKVRFATPIGITGAAFCVRCGLGGPRNGDLLVGAVNDGRIRSVTLNASRTATVGAVQVLGRAPSGIHSMEVGPDRRIYVSTGDAIYRLARA